MVGQGVRGLFSLEEAMSGAKIGFIKIPQPSSSQKESSCNRDE